MVSLYSADISDIAKPVKKEKKIATKKNDPKETTQPETDQGQVSMPPPKQRTEKQIAALARAQETRKRKQAEKLAAKEQQEAAEKEAAEKALNDEKEKEAKKLAQKEKRRLAREAKKNKIDDSVTSDKTLVPSETTSEIIDQAIQELEPPRKRQKKKDAPPSWFLQYVKGVKQEEAQHAEVKKPKKVIEREARTHAQEQWQDGFVRDRVQNENERHLSSMYSMIFGSR